MKRGFMTAAALAALLVTLPAWPCTPIGPTHRGAIDPAKANLDRHRPARPVVRLDRVIRTDETTLTVDCHAPYARFQIGETREPVSFTWEITAGAHVPEFRVAAPLLGIFAESGRALTIEWIESGEPVDFTIRFIAIDDAGNRSKPSRPIRIRTK